MGHIFRMFEKDFLMFSLLAQNPACQEKSPESSSRRSSESSDSSSERKKKKKKKKAPREGSYSVIWCNNSNNKNKYIYIFYVCVYCVYVTIYAIICLSRDRGNINTNNLLGAYLPLCWKEGVDPCVLGCFLRLCCFNHPAGCRK